MMSQEVRLASVWLCFLGAELFMSSTAYSGYKIRDISAMLKGENRGKKKAFPEGNAYNY